MSDVDAVERLKGETAAWFSALQGRVCAALESLEAEAEGPFDPAATAPGRFERRPWERTDHSGAPGGGGTMAMLRGRVFEKAGVHVSTVFGDVRARVPRPDSRARRTTRASGPPGSR